MRGPEQHPQRFADYFVICGLDKDSGLEPDKYFGEFHYLFLSIFGKTNDGPLDTNRLVFI